MKCLCGIKELMLPHKVQSRLNICNEEQSLTHGQEIDTQAQTKHDIAI
jgi:hypothetical protein